MSDDEVQQKVQLKPVKSNPLIQRIGIFAALALIIFLLGFVPMWLKARECSASLAAAEHQLTLVRMQSNLASAVIDARRGDYEPARQAASQFFTALQDETAKGDSSNFTPQQRGGVQPLITRRDEVITLLARGDPASADKLSELYASYRKIMNG